MQTRRRRKVLPPTPTEVSPPASSMSSKLSSLSTTSALTETNSSAITSTSDESTVEPLTPDETTSENAQQQILNEVNVDSAEKAEGREFADHERAVKNSKEEAPVRSKRSRRHVVDELEKTSTAKRPKPRGELAYLKYIAQWYTHFGDGQDGLSSGVDEVNFGLDRRRRTRSVRAKTYEQETYEAEQEIRRKRNEKKAAQLRLIQQKLEEEAQNRRDENQRRRREKEKQRLETKDEEKRENEEPTPSPSLSATPPAPDSHQTSLFVDGYKPFSYTLETDVEIPIPEEFFIPEIYSETTATVAKLEFTSCKELIESNNRKYYKEFKGFKPRIIKFQSTVFPCIYEEYLLMDLSRELQLEPFEEMGRQMELLAMHYFPDEEKLPIYNPADPHNSLVGEYSKALIEKRYEGAVQKIEEYNSIVLRIHSTNGFAKHLKGKKTISRILLHDILNQVYSRTVSPNINKLKGYESFSSNVYGELLPKFLSQIFDKVQLNSSKKFMDLGSGVGNVTLQAALEYGCESYGCEIMEGCSDLGDKQLTEFEQRCKLFGLNPAKCFFFHRQSFLDNPDLKTVLDDCDVILCNNFLFSPDLKERTLMLFDKLKPGTKVISLKSILPDSHHIEYVDDLDSHVNMFDVVKYDFEPNSVSWTHRGGVFYISEYTGRIVVENRSTFYTRSREKTQIKHMKLIE